MHKNWKKKNANSHFVHICHTFELIFRAPVLPIDSAEAERRYSIMNMWWRCKNIRILSIEKFDIWKLLIVRSCIGFNHYTETDMNLTSLNCSFNSSLFYFVFVFLTPKKIEYFSLCSKSIDLPHSKKKRKNIICRF